jgi:hypothetical protein
MELNNQRKKKHLKNVERRNKHNKDFFAKILGFYQPSLIILLINTKAISIYFSTQLNEIYPVKMATKKK